MSILWVTRPVRPSSSGEVAKLSRYSLMRELCLFGWRQGGITQVQWNIRFVLVTGITFAGGTRVGVVFCSNDGHLGSRWREGSQSRTSVNGDGSTCRVQEAKGKSVLFGQTNQLCSTTDLVPREQLRAWLNESSSCLLYTSPSPRDGLLSRMPSSA